MVWAKRIVRMWVAPSGCGQGRRWQDCGLGKGGVVPEGSIATAGWCAGWGATAPTWRVAGTDRLRPSTEMLTEMLMPAKRRLLFPKMEASALLGAWEGTVSRPRQTPGTRRALGGHSVPFSLPRHTPALQAAARTHLPLPGTADTWHGLMEPVDGFPVGE